MRPIQDYNLGEMALAINGLAISCFGTTQQAAVRPFLVVPRAATLENQTGGTPSSVSTPLAGYNIGYFSAYASGGVANNGFVGIGVRFMNRFWKEGLWTHATTTFTDDTADAQSTTANDFSIDTLTVNDGFVVLCTEPFNLISINCGTANSGTAAVRVLEYSLAATWSGAASIYVNNTASVATGELTWLWDPWPDWAPTVAAHGTNIPTGMYAVRIRATTAAGTTAALGSAMEIGRIYVPIGNVQQHATIAQDFGAKGAQFPGIGDGLIGYVSTPGTTIPSRFTFLWKIGP